MTNRATMSFEEMYNNRKFKNELVEECANAIAQSGELPFDSMEWIIIAVTHAVMNAHNVFMNCDDNDNENDLISFDQFQLDVEVALR